MPRGTDRYDQARLAGRLWTPAQITPLQLETWVDPNKGIDFATGVSKLYNLVPGANHLVQATTANQPGLVSTGPNALRMLSFDGSNDAVAASVAVYPNTAGYTAYAVAENNGAAGFRSIFGILSGAGFFQLRLDSAHTLSVLRNASANLITSSNTSATNAFHIVGGSTATNFSSVSLNGTETSNTTNPGFAGGWGNVGHSNGGERFAGRIGQIVICSTIQDALTRRKIEGYLAWSSGLVANLPAAHSFKNRPPLIGD